MVETIRREGPEMVRVTITLSRWTVRVTISIKKAASSRNWAATITMVELVVDERRST